METPGHILIVKPDEVDLLNMTALLQSEGYQFTMVQDEVEMIEAFERNEHDLVILEIQISGDKELELIQTIQRIAPGLPVIICTAQSTLPSTTISIQLPISIYLSKPFQPGLLLQLIETSIAHYKAFKQRESLLKRTNLYAWAIEETIQVLEATRNTFKSKKLAALRRQLERILNGEQNELFTR